MAKKKKQKAESESSSTASSTASSSAASSAAVSSSMAASSDAEAAGLQRAFDLGNFSMVRALAASASSAEAKAVAATLMSRVNVERQQLYVGFVGLAVVLTACVLVLTTG